MGQTHFLIGAAAGLALAHHSGADHTEALQLVALTCLGAALPDIDHPSAGLRQRLGFLGRIVFGWLRHRHQTHSLTALALLFAGVWYFSPALALPLGIGYASHLLADVVTPSGIHLLWPVYRRPVWLLPRPLRIPTSGVMEGVIAALVSVVVFGLLLDRAAIIALPF